MRRLVLCFLVCLSLMLPVFATYDDVPDSSVVLEADESSGSSDDGFDNGLDEWLNSPIFGVMIEDDQFSALIHVYFLFKSITLLFLGVIMLCCMKRW